MEIKPYAGSCGIGMRVPINLDLGCDFHLTYDNIENATRNPSTSTINGGRLPALGAPRIRDLSVELAGLISVLFKTHKI